MKWPWSWRSAKDGGYLVIGLGNPGAHYAATRHNMGARAVRALAAQEGWSWKRQRTLLVEQANGVRHGKELHLVVPMTYMNESGRAVGRVVRHDKWPVDRILVVVDDVALPLGRMRLRAHGSSGGHNGLKDIRAHLGTDAYARLRLGVGSPGDGQHGHQDLADFVLDPFAPQEQGSVNEMERRAAQVIDVLLTEGLERAMEEAQR